jgi:hypothetical protein
MGRGSAQFFRDLNCFVASPGELDGRLSVGKPNHKVKHLVLCASWKKCKRGRKNAKDLF